MLEYVLDMLGSVHSDMRATISTKPDLSPSIFRYLCLSTLLTRYMNIATGYDELLISPGGPHRGGVRPSSV